MGIVESPGLILGFFGLIFFGIVVVNIPVNLLLYSLPLALLCRRYGKDVGDLPRGSRAFTYTVVLVVLLISSFGALIDFVLIVGSSRPNAYWLGATVLIMLSAYVSSDRLLSLKPVPNLLQSAFLALMNPVFWTLLLFYEVEISSTNLLWIVIPLASLVLALIVMAMLRMWHAETYPQESEWADRMPEPARVVVVAYAVAVIALVVMSATLYVVFPGHEDRFSAPTTSMSRSELGTVVKYTFNWMSRTTLWSDVSIMLSDYPDSAIWHPADINYSTGMPVTHSESAAGGTRFGSLLVWCNITDVTGNGKIDAGDRFSFATGGAPTFDSSTDYYVRLIYDPTSEWIYTTTFTG